MSYVEERPWWPMQGPNKGRKKAKGLEEGEIGSSLPLQKIECWKNPVAMNDKHFANVGRFSS